MNMNNYIIIKKNSINVFENPIQIKCFSVVIYTNDMYTNTPFGFPLSIFDVVNISVWNAQITS